MYKNYFTHLILMLLLLFSNVLVAQDSENSSNTNNTSELEVDNVPNDSINLALSDDATLSGSESNGRGPLEAILYDPAINDYVITTDWNEYGVGYTENIGQPDINNAFFWQVDWSVPKAVNYITIGGSYENQPQPNTLWRISYLNNGAWTILEEGQGGWIDSGIFVWGGRTETPITIEGLRVQLYSDGQNDLVSILVRGRGGLSNNINDTITETKATLIQYLQVSPNLSLSEFESEAQNKMKLFPNPSSNETFISFGSVKTIEVIEIFDLGGRLVRRIRGNNREMESKRINIQGLSEGVYYITAIDNSGIRHQEKFIVSH